MASVEVALASALESREQSKKETGANLMFIGLAVWVAGALVAFSLPASTKMGSHGMSLTILFALGLMGLLLLIVGFLMRGNARGVSDAARAPSPGRIGC